MTEATGDGGEGLYVSSSGADGYDSDVMMAMGVKELLDWIIDLGGSYHITYMRDYLVDFKEYDGNNILLGDGRECRVRGMGKGSSTDDGWVKFHVEQCQSGEIKVIKGSLVVLSGTTRANCVYTLGGSTQQCMKSRVAKHLGVAGIQQHNGLVKETNVTLLAKEVQTQDLIYFHLARNREQHSTHKLFSYREDSNEAAFAVAKAEKIYAHESLTFNNTIVYEVISKWKAGLKDDIDARYDMVFLADARLRSGLPRFYNGKLVKTLLEGHSILSLEGSLSGDCDVEKNGKWSCIYMVGSQEYQVVCMRLDIALADVGILDKFDRGL
ncbi:hypothetical protein Tco_0410915 [Tanacetum coccineum]